MGFLRAISRLVSLFLLGLVLFSQTAKGDHAVEMSGLFNLDLKPNYELNPAPRSTIEFNYRHALNNPQKDKVTIKMSITNTSVLEHKDTLFAVVKYFDLSQDDVMKEESAPITLDADGNFSLTVPGLRPDAVYQMDVHLYRKNPENPKTGLFLASAGTYRGVTVADTALSKARHQAVTTLFLEENDWRLGRRGLKSAPYTGVDGGWCGQFPYWCKRPYFLEFDEEPSDTYKKWGKYSDKFEPPTDGEAIHGNYGLRNKHKFTVLGYSPKSGTVYTVEGNFGKSVQFNTRGTGSFHGYGRLTDGMVWKQAPKDPS